MTDIVDQLRDIDPWDWPDYADRTASEAADTIESLRADLADLTALKRDIANALRDLTTEATENIALRAQVAEWERLRDPSVLHGNLLRGVPAKLSRELILHLAGDAPITPSPNAINTSAGPAAAGD